MKKQILLALLLVIVLVLSAGILGACIVPEPEPEENPENVIALAMNQVSLPATATENLTLQNAVGEVTITWSSANSAVITAAGAVTRPDYTQTAVTVVLTAAFSYKGKSQTRDFTIIVPSRAMTDAEAVALAKSALTLASTATANLTLPATGANNVRITWQTSDAARISAAGAVTRPAYLTGDRSVTLTATLSRSSTTDTKTFTITVIKQDITIDEAISEVSKSIPAAVSADITLPSAYAGVSISWASSGIFLTAVGKVSRPPKLEGNKTVKLTATFTLGAAVKSITFEIIVQAQTETTEAEKYALYALLEQVKASLTGERLGIPDFNNVVANITLPTIDSRGFTITWSSSNSGVISANGTVYRNTAPGAASEAVSVTLTATIVSTMDSSVRGTKSIVCVVRNGTSTVTPDVSALVTTANTQFSANHRKRH